MEKCLFQWESNSRNSVPANKPSHPPRSRATGFAGGGGELSAMMLSHPAQLCCLPLPSKHSTSSREAFFLFLFFFLFAFAWSSPPRRTYILYEHADSYSSPIRLFPASICHISIRTILITLRWSKVSLSSLKPQH